MRRVLGTLSLVALLAACGGGGGGGYTEPKGKAINTITVDALSSLKFQKKQFSAPAGINLVRYVGKGGQHTLHIKGIEGFELKVSGDGQTDEAKVKLKPGTYTLYCNVPGHEAAGMEAKLVVT